MDFHSIHAYGITWAQTVFNNSQSSSVKHRMKITVPGHQFPNSADQMEQDLNKEGISSNVVFCPPGQSRFSLAFVTALSGALTHSRLSLYASYHA